MNHLRLLGTRATIRRAPLDRLDAARFDRDPEQEPEAMWVLVSPARGVEYTETAAGAALFASVLIYAADRLPMNAVVELPDGRRYRVVGSSAPAPSLRVYEHKGVEA